MNKKTVILSFFLLITLFFAFIKFNFINFEIEFEKLHHVHKKINVYYNGYKIGESKKIRICKNSNNSCISVIADSKTVFLPRNLKAKMKQKKINHYNYEDYIELVYPKNPSKQRLLDGSRIKGELASGFHNYLTEEIDYSDMEQVKIALISTTINLEKTVSLLADVLISLNETIKNSKNEIKSTVKNLSDSSSDVKVITKKLSTSIDEGKIEKIIDNIDKASENLNSSSKNVKNIAEKLSPSIVENLEKITENTDEITQGVNSTLKKPFGGVRLIFGKVIEKP